MSSFFKKRGGQVNAANIHITEAEAALAQSDFNVEKITEIQSKFTGGVVLLVPGRIFIREGTMWKVCRKGLKRRQFFLFNDVLVYGSIVASRYSHQQVLPLSQMSVSSECHYQSTVQATFDLDREQLDEQLDVANAFQISHANKSFHVIALSAADKANWLANLQKHIDRVVQLGGEKMTRAVWVPDAMTKDCMICGQRFSAFVRKHHCRQCGRVVCSSCSPHRLDLRLADSQREPKAERTCSECFHKRDQPARTNSHSGPSQTTSSDSPPPPAAVAAKLVATVLRSQRPAQPRLNKQDDSTDTEDSDDSETEEQDSKTVPDSHPTPPQESHPTPPHESHPTPPQESHPTPPQESHPTPPHKSHPTPPQESHPTPPQESHPTPPQESHPTPPHKSHPTPPQESHPTPPPRKKKLQKHNKQQLQHEADHGITPAVPQHLEISAVGRWEERDGGQDEHGTSRDGGRDEHGTSRDGGQDEHGTSRDGGQDEHGTSRDGGQDEHGTSRDGGQDEHGTSRDGGQDEHGTSRDGGQDEHGTSRDGGRDEHGTSRDGGQDERGTSCDGGRDERGTSRDGGQDEHGTSRDGGQDEHGTSRDGGRDEQGRTMNKELEAKSQRRSRHRKKHFRPEELTPASQEQALGETSSHQSNGAQETSSIRHKNSGKHVRGRRHKFKDPSS